MMAKRTASVSSYTTKRRDPQLFMSSRQQLQRPELTGGPRTNSRPSEAALTTFGGVELIWLWGKREPHRGTRSRSKTLPSAAASNNELNALSFWLGSDLIGIRGLIDRFIPRMAAGDR